MAQKNVYPLRLDDTLKKKLQKLAKENDRSFRGQVENILKHYVADYEDKNGEIKVNSD